MTNEVRDIIISMRKIGFLLSKIAKIKKRCKLTILRVLKGYDFLGFVKPAKSLVGHES